MDLLDRAMELEEEQREKALSFRYTILVGPVRDSCLECDDPIPPGRKKAIPGCQLCVDCQQKLEGLQRYG